MNWKQWWALDVERETWGATRPEGKPTDVNEGRPMQQETIQSGSPAPLPVHSLALFAHSPASHARSPRPAHDPASSRPIWPREGGTTLAGFISNPGFPLTSPHRAPNIAPQ